MKLYHYRSVETAIKEIREGTIYFADVSELNDPIEGYVQMYWQGDKPAWEGLFRNYICSLHQSITLYLLDAEDVKIKECSVLIDAHHFDKLPLGAILSKISEEFLRDKYVQGIISYLAHDRRRCSAELLRLALRAMHEIAFAICVRNMKECGVIPKEQPEHYIDIGLIIDSFPHDAASDLGDKEREALFEVFSSAVEDVH